MKNTLLCMVALLAVSCDRREEKHPPLPREQVVFNSVQAPDVKAGTGFESKLPAGWAEVPGSGMRMASYTIEGSSIDFSLISLMMGDVPSNVNRWRGQVALPPASPEEIAKDVITFKADGHNVSYIEIYNTEAGRGIVAAIVDLAPQYWFYTAKGTVAELKAHAGDIRQFLESIKFN